jgi:Mg-chelatase subunit ChlI
MRLPTLVSQSSTQLGIDSLRAAITLFEAARAYAAIDARLEVTSADLREVAPMALRLRRSTFMKEFFEKQEAEEKELVYRFGLNPRPEQLRFLLLKRYAGQEGR